MLIVESDSSVAIGWVYNPSSALWMVRNIVAHIEILRKQVRSWTIDHVLRECNSVADALAKEGVNRMADLVVGVCFILMYACNCQRGKCLGVVRECSNNFEGTGLLVLAF
ncbi:hypothetical protein DITRI_Ditri03aG0115300 [Diplodiscus trichospermus]